MLDGLPVSSIWYSRTLQTRLFAGLLCRSTWIVSREPRTGRKPVGIVCLNWTLRYRVVKYDRRGGMWLKGRGPVDTLCRGEVAEWLNAAVSKTVTSAIPASGVRIPPSPHFSTLRPSGSACQHAPAFGFRFSARPLFQGTCQHAVRL